VQSQRSVTLNGAAAEMHRSFHCANSAAFDGFGLTEMSRARL